MENGYVKKINKNHNFRFTFYKYEDGYDNYICIIMEGNMGFMLPRKLKILDSGSTNERLMLGFDYRLTDYIERYNDIYFYNRIYARYNNHKRYGLYLNIDIWKPADMG
jgi:hypothetical protein